MKKILLTPLLLLSWMGFGQNIDIIWNYTADNSATNFSTNKIGTTATITLTVSNLATVDEFDDVMKNSTIKISNYSKSFEAIFQELDQTKYADKRAIFTISSLDLLIGIDPSLRVDGASIELALKDKTKLKKFTIAIDETDAEAQERIAVAQSTAESALAEQVAAAAAKKEQEDMDGVTTSDLSPELAEWIQKATVKIDGELLTIGSIYDDESRYDVNDDRAFIIVDENGTLMGNSPVNIDQDDIIYVIMIGKPSEIKNYNVDYVGTYKPVDLQMRSYDTPAITPKMNSSTKDFSARVFTRGPFTSETVTIKIKKGKELKSSYSLRVNKLFHLAFGISANITDLQNPTYVLQPLDATTNTIVAKDNGKRTLMSFNVIWYWRSTFRYLLPGSSITRGRDVLKEPSFWERINPSFGVSLNGNFSRNLFFGGNFEFARGGTINAGYHWGKVNKLMVKDFKFGETAYTGTTVPVSEEWDGRFFIGIMLDTRIFNSLFTTAK